MCPMLGKWKAGEEVRIRALSKGTPFPMYGKCLVAINKTYTGVETGERFIRNALLTIYSYVHTSSDRSEAPTTLEQRILRLLFYVDVWERRV